MLAAGKDFTQRQNELALILEEMVPTGRISDDRQVRAQIIGLAHEGCSTTSEVISNLNFIANYCKWLSANAVETQSQ